LQLPAAAQSRSDERTNKMSATPWNLKLITACAVLLQCMRQAVDEGIAGLHLARRELSKLNRTSVRFQVAGAESASITERLQLNVSMGAEMGAGAPERQRRFVAWPLARCVHVVEMSLETVEVEGGQNNVDAAAPERFKQSKPVEKGLQCKYGAAALGTALLALLTSCAGVHLLHTSAELDNHVKRPAAATKECCIFEPIFDMKHFSHEPKPFAGFP
jgi:hypothetical protein